MGILRLVGTFFLIGAQACVSPRAEPLPPPAASSEGQPPALRGPAAQTPAHPAADHPSSTLRVRFVLDPGFDASRVFGVLSGKDPAGFESRARDMGIALDAARQIRAAASMAEARDVLAPIIDERYARLGPELDVARRELESSWAEVAERFSRVVAELSEHPFVHEEYVVVVSAFHQGLSDWVGNLVAVGAALEVGWRRRIAAHEITLSHLFQLLRQRHGPDEVSDQVAWAFAEITTVFLLDDERLLPFWPKHERAGSYFTRSNYPQLAPLEPRLKALWDGRTSFSAYLTAATGVLAAALNRPSREGT